MLPVLPVIRLCAARLGTYPSSSAAASTRLRVARLTRVDSASARDTVDVATPALIATSRMVTGTVISSLSRRARRDAANDCGPGQALREHSSDLSGPSLPGTTLIR